MAARKHPAKDRKIPSTQDAEPKKTFLSNTSTQNAIRNGCFTAVLSALSTAMQRADRLLRKITTARFTVTGKTRVIESHAWLAAAKNVGR